MKTLLIIVALLFATAAQAQITAPALRPPNGQPYTTRTIELGRKLFHDRRASRDGTVSCADCHEPDNGFADRESLAVGVFGRVGTRHAGTIENVAFSRFMFWDGRTDGMPTQSLQPLVNQDEMANDSEQQVLNRFERIAGYRQLFSDAYGGRDRNQGQFVTRERWGHALASYQFTLTCVDTPALRYINGDQNALTPEQVIGFELFKQGNCMECHPAPLFTKFEFRNNGMDMAGKKGQVRLDDGRFDIANLRNGESQEAFRRRTLRAFKVPSLINVGQRSPLNHVGTFNLRRCLVHYNDGGFYMGDNGPERDRYIDKRIVELHYTPQQLDFLELFMREGLKAYDSPVPSPPPALPGLAARSQ